MSQLQPPFGTLVFDLDGTLVDSNRDLVPALNYATATEGLPPIKREEVGHVVGKGALAMIARSFDFHGHTLAPDTHQKLLKLFLEYYEAHIADETVFFDGCFDALDGLASKGWELCVCTNKYEHLGRKLLNALGSTHRFPIITGGDTFAVKKPDPAHILETIALTNGTPERSIMVGDSINDIAAAQAANIPSIAVDFGYTDVPVKQLNPDVVISHFDELANAVETLSNGWSR